MRSFVISFKNFGTNVEQYRVLDYKVRTKTKNEILQCDGKTSNSV